MSAEWAEEPAPSVGAHPGAQLAAQRQALGWTVEQVAEQLKLAKRQVIALEAGDYAALPGTAVVRGFIRAYAKVLKLDAAPLVAMVEPDPPVPSDMAPVRREKPQTFSEVRFPTSGDKPFPFGWLIGAVVVVGVGFAAYQFGLVPVHLSSATPPAAVAEPAAPAAEAPVTPVETTLLKADQELSPVQAAPTLVPVPAATPEVQGANTAAPAAAAPAPAPVAAAAAPAAATPAASKPASAAAPATVAPAPVAAAPAAATPAPAKPGPNALVFTVRGEAWIEVRSAATNKVLLSRLAKPGTSDFIEITEPVNLVVGKPEEVSATLRGTALELKPVAGGTTARLSLK
jgi:cytoskeleton protein RodZ